MKELITQGGPLIFLLLACSLLAVAVFLERFFHFHRSTVVVQDLLQGVGNLINRKNYVEALTVTSGTPGPVARVMKTVLMRPDAPRDELKAVVQEAGQLEVPRLERHLTVLVAIAYIAPLIGLLGTVLGLVDTFAPVAQNGFATATEMSRGIYRSLVTSAAGIAVAIPAYVIYAYLSSVVKNLMHDMERAGIEVVNMIMQSRETTDIVGFKEGAKAVAEERRRRASGGPK
ncbi:MAG TPA: MotA/TolQ/ExbB proton channel family protein [Verrucomicrobiales bacterium]|jgi:biopolymer transport protein ExbB|nr:MotA/TolQ/ExbB proton channel family protein [Verrucomicrobiales bacterium]